MVNVEIDNRHASQAMHRLGVPRRDGNGVEQTKSHRMGRLGMMARRPNRTEGIVRLSTYHGVHCCRDGADRPQRGWSGARRKNGIGIERGMSRARHRRQNRSHEGLIVDPHDIGLAAQRRILSNKGPKLRLFQRRQDGGKTRRRFRVTMPRLVRENGIGTPAIMVMGEVVALSPVYALEYLQNMQMAFDN